MLILIFSLISVICFAHYRTATTRMLAESGIEMFLYLFHYVDKKKHMKKEVIKENL